MFSLTIWLKNLSHRTPKPAATNARSPRRRRRLEMEWLEDRRLLCDLGPGSLDESFDVDGKLTTDFGSSDTARAVAVQPDGKIVVAGHGDSLSVGSNFSIARYNTNGSLDTTFGSGGKLNVDFKGRSDGAHQLALQPDGKIVVAGWATPSGNTAQGKDWGIIRLNTNGTLDNSFANKGKLTLGFGGSWESASAGVAIQSDGKIVIAGVGSGNCFGATFCGFYTTIRLNTNGTLDSSFDGDGKVQTDTDPTTDREDPRGMRIQADGKIVVGGSAAYGISPHGVLVRYNTNGALDTSFGSGGIATFATVAVSSLAIQADGRIVTTGSSGVPHPNYDAIQTNRFNSNGTLDTSFGSGGSVQTIVGPGGSRGNSVAIQTDGRILVGGNSHTDAENSIPMFTVVRYNSDGNLDTSFDGDGIATTSIGSSSSINAIAIQPSDGHIVAVGGSVGDFALARYCA
jgi:uncharacterized delta-60 repeat protein